MGDKRFTDRELGFIRIPSPLRYALEGARVLAVHRGRLGVKAVATRCGVPAEFLAKIFTRLAGARLLTSQRGPGGGFALARDPESIRVDEVLGAVGGPGREAETCLISQRPCGGSRVCAIHDTAVAAERALTARFRSLTLATIAGRPTTGTRRTGSMRMTVMVSGVLGLLLLGGAGVASDDLAAGGASSATAVDKAGGLYPNDFGPAEIDVAAYPKEQRANYKVFAFKCAACHTIARPINSQFLELTAAEVAKAKQEEPELFADPRIVKAEPDVWRRYVKRMMGKAGCPVKPADGKQIWSFLVYDAKIRKMGANGAAWRQHRAHLLHEFSEHYGDVYKILFGDAKAPAGN